jgi:hypothetical protein
MNYLTSKKTAFLCSRIEKDVLHYLLKGKEPIILVLACGLKKHRI